MFMEKNDLHIKRFRNTNYFISDNGIVYYEKNGIMIKRKNTLNKNTGYSYIPIRINKKQSNFYIHRLVAECFLNDFNYDLYVNHKDLDKQNNNVENLEMVTPKENTIHYIKSIRGEDWTFYDKNRLKKIKKENHRVWAVKNREKLNTYMREWNRRNKKNK